MIVDDIFNNKHGMIVDDTFNKIYRNENIDL